MAHAARNQTKNLQQYRYRGVELSPRFFFCRSSESNLRNAVAKGIKQTMFGLQLKFNVLM